MVCKRNCASHVKRNPPHSPTVRPNGNGTSCSIDLSLCRYSPRFYVFRFCLTSCMRPNYYYTPEHHANAQTQPARPEGRRTEAVRHAQPPFGNGDGSPVQTEPLLRSPRSSAGPLRDAATPHRRTDVDSRRSCCFWRFAPHVLSGPRVFPTIWTGRPIASSARAEGWAQAERGSSGLCGQFAGGRSQAHNRSVRESHSRTLCNYRPQAQSRASSGATQKKTAGSNLTFSVPADAAATYEALRPYLIDPADQSGATRGPAVLLRHGMLAWTSASRQPPTSSLSSGAISRSPVPSEVSKELVQVMAGLLLHHGKDFMHA